MARALAIGFNPRQFENGVVKRDHARTPALERLHRLRKGVTQTFDEVKEREIGVGQRPPDEPPAVREEILSINTDATNLALQVALLVPILAGLLGLFNSFRMMRLPDVAPSAQVEAAALA